MTAIFQWQSEAQDRLQWLAQGHIGSLWLSWELTWAS